MGGRNLFQAILNMATPLHPPQQIKTSLCKITLVRRRIPVVLDVLGQHCYPLRHSGSHPLFGHLSPQICAVARCSTASFSTTLLRFFRVCRGYSEVFLLLLLHAVRETLHATLRPHQPPVLPLPGQLSLTPPALSSLNPPWHLAWASCPSL